MGTREPDLRGILAREVASRRLARRFPRPSYMELFVTEACNLRCGYCFVKEKTDRRMTSETARKAGDFLMEASGPEESVYIRSFGIVCESMSTSDNEP